MLEIHSKRIPPDVIVLELAGRIILGRDAQHLEWMGTALVRDKEKKVVLDLSNVSRVDSTGVGIIMMVCGLLKQSGGELRLAGAKGLVEDVLKLTNVHNIVAIHSSAEAAAASFGSAYFLSWSRFCREHPWAFSCGSNERGGPSSHASLASSGRARSG